MSANSSGTSTLRSQKTSAKKKKETLLEHISVCLCTYRRPQLLDELLEGLTRQVTHDNFEFSVVVVDNDIKQSGKEIVEHYINNSGIDVQYYHQPIKGLTYARNKSLEHSKGKYIAFLDDDEVPDPEWLFHLYMTMKKYNADAVFGSVIPKFEVAPPDWIQKRKFFYWRDMRDETGTETGKYATNNALVRRNLVMEHKIKFDHDFAYIGGEDEAFFFELLNHKPDAKFLNCKDAIVYENISTDRCDPNYIQKRNILEGKGRVFGVYKFSETRLKQKRKLISRFLNSYFRLIAIWLVLPILLLYKKEIGAEYYYRNYYHIGIILAVFDVSPYKDRQSIGLK